MTLVDQPPVVTRILKGSSCEILMCIPLVPSFSFSFFLVMVYQKQPIIFSKDLKFRTLCEVISNVLVTVFSTKLSFLSLTKFLYIIIFVASNIILQTLYGMVKDSFNGFQIISYTCILH